jgi:hypothetical protein
MNDLLREKKRWRGLGRAVAVETIKGFGQGQTKNG